MPELTRYKQILDLVAGDEKADRLSGDLISAGLRYISKVVEMEHQLAVGKHSLTGEKLRIVTEELDQARTMAHEALITTLHVFTRYLTKEYGEELKAEGLESGIFLKPEAIHDRVAIADWAGRLVYGIYDKRRR